MTDNVSLEETILIVLASGQSRRFGTSNKLLSLFRGNPLCSYSARLDRANKALKKIAVINGANCDEDYEVAQIYARQGWCISKNMRAASGQASSLKTGIDAALEKCAGKTEPQAALILLADMPKVDDVLIENLIGHMNACQENGTCHGVMCRSSGVYIPPALFRKSQFSLLRQAQGDRGAGQFLQKIEGLASLECSSDQLIDIDVSADLEKYA